jgi:hypothetical protein
MRLHKTSLLSHILFFIPRSWRIKQDVLLRVTIDPSDVGCRTSGTDLFSTRAALSGQQPPRWCAEEHEGEAVSSGEESG